MVTGSKSAIGGVAVPLSSTSVLIVRFLTVRALASNTGTIYLGTSAAVTAGTDDETDGFPIVAGDVLQFDLKADGVGSQVDVSELWVIADTPGQKLSWAVDL
jgi:hypothetical protein